MKHIQFFSRMFKAIPLILLGGCSATEVVNSISKIFYRVEIKKDIPFGEHISQKYDLYLPVQTQTPITKTPVIVFFYGGSWNRGEKAEYEFVGRRLAAMGYIAAIPNYRLYPEVKYPDFLKDCAKSIAHLKTELTKTEYLNYKVDSSYIVMGHSAGAYNAAMLALDNRWIEEATGIAHQLVIKGFIGMAGAYNIYPISDTEVQPVFNYPNYPPASQPIEYTNKRNPPALILTPETDTFVSIERNSHALQKALQFAGNRAQIESIRGTDHITLIGTLSPVLFFKGNTSKAIEAFVCKLNSDQGYQ